MLKLIFEEKGIGSRRYQTQESNLGMYCLSCLLSGKVFVTSLSRAQVTSELQALHQKWQKFCLGERNEKGRKQVTLMREDATEGDEWQV